MSDIWPKATIVQRWIIQFSYQDTETKDGFIFDTKENAENALQRLINKQLCSMLEPSK